MEEGNFESKTPKTLEEIEAEMVRVEAELTNLYEKLDKHKNGENLLSDDEYGELKIKIDDTHDYIEILNDQIEDKKNNL